MKHLEPYSQPKKKRYLQSPMPSVHLLVGQSQRPAQTSFCGTIQKNMFHQGDAPFFGFPAKFFFFFYKFALRPRAQTSFLAEQPFMLMSHQSKKQARLRDLTRWETSLVEGGDISQSHVGWLVSFPYGSKHCLRRYLNP